MANQSWRWQRRRQRVSEATVVSELSKSGLISDLVQHQSEKIMMKREGEMVLEKKICRNLWNILPLLLLPFQHCSKSYVAVLTSFGRRQRAHKGWRFPVLLLHQIWFHLSAPWWKVIRGGSDLEQREISTSLRR
ncbi:hypothetical protein IGI04_010912 [Brassica rapa subsp. trilocularis]|uniref:Uncharacterized protein n=1 Tax=Brassica rapa subsp. trilocularis TaxID=1813537 RepID=A0ABQ7N1J8_BRACM|nr:hypothetical protein IGI04_010912 [Brassica rapa subsp. trilocularis]